MNYTCIVSAYRSKNTIFESFYLVSYFLLILFAVHEEKKAPQKKILTNDKIVRIHLKFEKFLKTIYLFCEHEVPMEILAHSTINWMFTKWLLVHVFVFIPNINGFFFSLKMTYKYFIFYIIVATTSLMGFFVLDLPSCWKRHEQFHMLKNDEKYFFSSTISLLR